MLLKYKIRLGVIALGSLIAGCANNSYFVTYDTIPQGAEIICEGSSRGYSPVNLSYDMDRETKKEGIIRVRPCRANWISGATKYFDNIFDLKKFPKGVHITVRRPEYPNAHIDHQFSLQIQQNRKLDSIQFEQGRVRNEKTIEDTNRSLCNQGLLPSVMCN